mgnify:CR=1 FL=1
MIGRVIYIYLQEIISTNTGRYRFLFGSNKVLIKALGDSPESAYKENLEKLSSVG